ncbi:MAG: class I SAM-dependent methyltransferase [Thiohalomonadales bacterium]
MKNSVVNTDMSDYWNGDGGRNWMRFQQRLASSLQPFGQRAMLAMNFSGGEKILDIGCGCGDTTFEIAQAVGASGYVQGIDISELILQQGRNRLKTFGLDNIRFKCVDAESNRFTVNSFDAAYSRFGVMFFNDPVVAFTNISEVLVPNGRVSFICWQPIAANQWVTLPLDIVNNHVTNTPVINADLPGAFSFGDKNKVVRILQAAGFVDISIEKFEIKFNVGNTIDEAVIFLSHLGPASSVIEDPDIDATTKNAIGNDLHNSLIRYETAEGVNLDAATWVVTASKM